MCAALLLLSLDTSSHSKNTRQDVPSRSSKGMTLLLYRLPSRWCCCRTCGTDTNDGLIAAIGLTLESRRGGRPALFTVGSTAGKDGGETLMLVRHGEERNCLHCR